MDGDLRFGVFISEAGRGALGLDEPESAASENSGEKPEADAEPSSTDSIPSSPRPGSKQALIVDLLHRKQGATLDELVNATGWLPHTARAALTGLRKKGHTVAKSKRGDATCYSIAKA